VNLRQTSGPVLERPGDLAALLTNLQARDVLFVDEIHRLTPVVEEVLYPAMEDYQLDIMIGEGPAARSIRLSLPPFTLVGATTRSTCSRWIVWGSTPWTASSSRRSSSASTAARSVSIVLPRRSARSAARWKTSPSRS